MRALPVTLLLVGALAAPLAAAAPAAAEPFGRPGAAPGLPAYPGALVVRGSNIVGGGYDLIIARGATGADTIQTSSAAGGNAGQPERAIPQGSGGGRGGSR